MSAEAPSSSKTVEIHIPLLGEGTDVLRPTRGRVLGDNEVEVLATADYDPAIEAWRCPPGTKVGCEKEVRGGREVLVANMFAIGHDDWANEIRGITTTIHPAYWQDFKPVSIREIEQVEQDVCRSLPNDFRLFWEKLGFGRFPEPFGGHIYSPDDVRMACHGPLLMKLGSAEWASEEEQRQFYRSRGAFNPAPDKFTAEALICDGVSLLDLLQIGTDGSCGYHQLYVGHSPGPLVIA